MQSLIKETKIWDAHDTELWALVDDCLKELRQRNQSLVVKLHPISRTDILKMPGVGKATAKEICEFLWERGIKVIGYDPPASGTE